LNLGLEFDIFFQIRYIGDAGTEGFDILEEEMLWDYVLDVIGVDVGMANKDSSDRVVGARERIGHGFR
jgi:hypothetical protein